jgi:hypothetical protein
LSEEVESIMQGGDRGLHCFLTGVLEGDFEEIGEGRKPVTPMEC